MYSFSLHKFVKKKLNSQKLLVLKERMVIDVLPSPAEN